MKGFFFVSTRDEFRAQWKTNTRQGIIKQNFFDWNDKTNLFSNEVVYIFVHFK